MTTATVLLHDQHLFGLSVSGHAGYGVHGEDIVCAAISILITTCANALETVAHIVPNVVQDEQTTTITVSLPIRLTKQQRHDALIILQTTLQGFEDIATQYPSFFQLLDRRKTSC